MSTIAQFQLMANYNQWMNDKVYQAAALLSEEELAANRSAFFGSILGTLNHLLVADIIWLKRFSQHQFLQENFSHNPFSQQPSPQNPMPEHQEQQKLANSLSEISSRENPASLDAILFSDFSELTEQRGILDNTIINFINELTDEAIASPLSYKNTKGVSFHKPFSFLLLHFFNHQTHHRGQVTTLLSQQGIDVDPTDLLVLIPEV